MSENAFKLNLLAYMNIYSVVNVEYLKLYEPSILTKDEAGSDHILLSLYDLAPKEDSILQKKVCATTRDEINIKETTN